MTINNKLLKITVTTEYVDDDGNPQTHTMIVPQANSLDTTFAYDKYEGFEEVSSDPNFTVSPTVQPNKILFVVGLVHNSEIDHFLEVHTTELFTTPPME